MLEAVIKSNDKDARERIIEVTLNILDEVDDIEKVTVWQIVERANVGVGLINYHFKTKDNFTGVFLVISIVLLIMYVNK